MRSGHGLLRQTGAALSPRSLRSSWSAAVWAAAVLLGISRVRDPLFNCEVPVVHDTGLVGLLNPRREHIDRWIGEQIGERSAFNHFLGTIHVEQVGFIDSGKGSGIVVHDTLN